MKIIRIGNLRAERLMERTIGMGFGVIYILLGLLAIVEQKWYYLVGCVGIHIICYVLPIVQIKDKTIESKKIGVEPK